MTEEKAPEGVQETNTATEATEPKVLETTEVESSLSGEARKLFDQMMQVGAFYGRSKSRTNPLMKANILTTRSGFEVIDLEKTIDQMEKAAKFLEEKAKYGAPILVIGTSPATKNLVKELAEELDLPYVTERWLGGTLTNFKTITNRTKYFRKLKEDKETGKLAKYTKKEQLQKDKELVKLERLFGGIENLTELPSALFIADLKENEFPAKEAIKRGIPVVAITNTDSNPKLATHIITANDRNEEAIKIIIDNLKEAIKKGKAAKEKAVGEVSQKPAEGASATIKTTTNQDKL